MSHVRRAAVLDLDLRDVERVLERVRPQVAAGDHACLVALVQTLIELTRLVRERGTTIARLRSLLGGLSSERTEHVCGDSGPPGGDAAAEGASTSSSDGTPETPDQSALGKSDPAAGDGTEDRGDGSGGGSDKTRKGHGRIPASAYTVAEHVTVEHSTLRSGDTCPGCSHGKLYLLCEPACIVRIFGQAPLAARCWDCERLRCGGCGHVFTAAAPAEAQGPKHSESAAAMMAILRYGAGMPLHRLARLQSHLRIPAPATTQWEVARDHAEALQPVHEQLVRGAAAGNVIGNDDTYARILSLMGKRRAKLLAAGALPDPDRTGLFTTGVVADTAEGPVALFFTGPKHAGENLTDVLDERDAKLGPPVQICDGLARNLPKGHQVLLANCLAHGRRHVVGEADNFPAECRHVLEQLSIVFHTEAKCRKDQLTDDQRLELHQRESRPVMEALERWIGAQLDEKRVEPNSGLGQAFQYLRNRWSALTLFLRVPGAPLDNNAVERILKAAIRHRNNSLFYRSERGARVGDLYMALIHTAELHCENPFDYLTALLEHESELAHDPAAWLPWTYRATLAARVPQRAAA